jgi:hypothetical protein
MDFNRKLLFLSVFLFTSLTIACVQEPPLAPREFTDSSLGFRYIPPSNIRMRDWTAIDRESMRAKAAARGTTNVLTLLLSLRSDLDDTAPDWCSVGIETYPREKYGTLSDDDASMKFSRSVARHAKEVDQPSNVTIGSIHFVVSTFELQEGQLIKRAHVYTTVRRGLLLSLAFSANSLNALDAIVSSVRSFTPIEAR